MAAPCLGDGLSRTEILDLFSQGKDFFRQGNEVVAADPDAARESYRKAVMRFERIVKEGGIHNGMLFYNIGNVYFRLEDIGRAILYYRRAELYIRGDLNLQQNLKYARARRLDKVEEEQKAKVLKTLFFWHYDLSTKARSMVFIACFVAVWVLASVRVFLRSGTLGWCLAVSAILAAMFLGSLVTETALLRRRRPGVVISREVVARKGDSGTYEKSFTHPLHAGTEFTLIEDRSDWLNIGLQDGRCCWIPAKSAELVR